eukprot:scaffold31817_cov83-Phaeocystis_antarctica.AAC.2
MEYCDGGDLQAYLKTRQAVDEPEAVRLLTQLLVALKFIHGQEVRSPATSMPQLQRLEPGAFSLTLFAHRACRWRIAT